MKNPLPGRFAESQQADAAKQDANQTERELEAIQRQLEEVLENFYAGATRLEDFYGRLCCGDVLQPPVKQDETPPPDSHTGRLHVLLGNLGGTSMRILDTVTQLESIG